MASTFAFAPIKVSRLSTIIFSPSSSFSNGGRKRLVVKAAEEANVPQAGAPVAVGPKRVSEIVSGWLDHIEIRNQYRDLWNQTRKHPTTKETNTTSSIEPQKSTVGKIDLKSSKIIIMAALTMGLAVLLVDQKAIAMGPEGPLMEEFWENMRRYALYALTVSSGVAYAVFQPLYELLRNPISALLVIAIGIGSFYLVSQVLYAMVGVSDFTYQYSY